MYEPLGIGEGESMGFESYSEMEREKLKLLVSLSNVHSPTETQKLNTSWKKVTTAMALKLNMSLLVSVLNLSLFKLKPKS